MGMDMDMGVVVFGVCLCIYMCVVSYIMSYVSTP